MFGLFQRKYVLDMILSLVEGQIGTYGDLVNRTIREIADIFTVIKNKRDREELEKSLKTN